jgi:hypothetical protein
MYNPSASYLPEVNIPRYATPATPLPVVIIDTAPNTPARIGIIINAHRDIYDVHMRQVVSYDNFFARLPLKRHITVVTLSIRDIVSDMINTYDDITTFVAAVLYVAPKTVINAFCDCAHIIATRYRTP